MISLESSISHKRRKRKLSTNKDGEVTDAVSDKLSFKKFHGKKMNVLSNKCESFHKPKNVGKSGSENISGEKSKRKKTKKKKSTDAEFSGTEQKNDEKNDYLSSQIKMKIENVLSKKKVTMDSKEKSSETKMKPSSNKKVADVTHKHSSGNNNWMKFLQEQNIKPKTLKPVKPLIQRSDINENKSRQTTPKVTRLVGLDCEMVGIGDHGRENMLARVSLVNSNGQCIYDKFVKPREIVVDYRTPVSGVRPEDMLSGEEFSVVQKNVAEILKNRILVGHALKSDLDVLFISHPRKMIRDTSKYLKEPGKGTPSLKKLALEYLGVKIQEGEHNSVLDAKAAVQLYNMFRKEWESGDKSAKANHFRNMKTFKHNVPENV